MKPQKLFAFSLIAITALLSACTPSASAPSEASVPLKSGESYTLEVKGITISKGNTYSLTVGNQTERRKTAGKDWFFITGDSKTARGVNFNYYPDRDHLSVVVILDAAIDGKSDKASKLEVLYCELKRGSTGWVGQANYDSSLKEKTLKDGTCTLRRT